MGTGLPVWNTLQDVTAFKCNVDCTEVPLMSVTADSTSRQPNLYSVVEFQLVFDQALKQ